MTENVISEIGLIGWETQELKKYWIGIQEIWVQAQFPDELVIWMGGHGTV